MRSILTGCVAAFAMTTSAFACSPSPACWLSGSKSDLRSMCEGYVKSQSTLEDIASSVDEPGKMPAFAKACKAAGFTIKAR